MSNPGADVFVFTEGHMDGHVNASVRPTRRGRRPWHVWNVPPAVDGTPGWSLCRLRDWLKLPPPEFGWRHEPVPLDQPSGIVGLTEFEQRLPQLLDGLEVPNPQQVLLQSSDEPFSTAISLGRTDEGR